MALIHLMKDKIDVLKADGTKHEKIMSSVSNNNIITIFNPQFPITSDDLIIRKTSVGFNETYQVMDPKFSEGMTSAIPPHYKLKVKKLGIPEANSAVQHITYNFNGHNSRMNNNSLDNSVNSVQTENRALLYVNDLRDVLKTAKLSVSDRTEALEVVNAIESQFQSGNPKKSIVCALLAGLPHLESIMAITTGITTLVK